jgi:hypothetical protein
VHLIDIVICILHTERHSCHSMLLTSRPGATTLHWQTDSCCDSSSVGLHDELFLTPTTLPTPCPCLSL